MTFGAPADIINLCVYDWYEWTYCRNHGTFPEKIDKLGILLGPIQNEGNKIARVILKIKGTVVTRPTMRKLRKSELVCESEKIKRNLFDDIIEKKIRRSVSYPDNPIPERYIPHKDNSEEAPPSSPDDADPVDSDVSATFKKPITDHIIRF